MAASAASATAVPGLTTVVVPATGAHVSLGPSIQKQLNADKIQLRIENELYLRQHPEIKNIVSYFTSQVLVHRPANIPDFAVGVLADADLKDKVDSFVLESSHNQTDLSAIK